MINETSVARGLASHLRLKHRITRRSRVSWGGRQGPGISSEIETGSYDHYGC